MINYVYFPLNMIIACEFDIFTTTLQMQYDISFLVSINHGEMTVTARQIYHGNKYNIDIVCKN